MTGVREHKNDHKGHKVSAANGRSYQRKWKESVTSGTHTVALR